MSSLKQTSSRAGHLLTSVLRWFDSEANIESITTTDQKKVDWLRIVPLLFLHLMCLGVCWVGWSWTAIGVALLLYCIRMFAITGFYHRYFSHKAFKTNRFWQFIFGAMGNASVQRGPLWWAAHHRHHHRFTDQEQDVHSPSCHGFLWSHIGWLTSKANFPTNYKYDTQDTSRNNLLLALITLGEGWHNNHHHFAVSARQGFFWWEIDITYYALFLLARLGIVSDLRPVPEHVIHKNLIIAESSTPI